MTSHSQLPSRLQLGLLFVVYKGRHGCSNMGVCLQDQLAAKLVKAVLNASSRHCVYSVHLCGLFSGSSYWLGGGGGGVVCLLTLLDCVSCYCVVLLRPF